MNTAYVYGESPSKVVMMFRWPKIAEQSPELRFTFTQEDIVKCPLHTPTMFIEVQYLLKSTLVAHRLRINKKISNAALLLLLHAAKERRRHVLSDVDG